MKKYYKDYRLVSKEQPDGKVKQVAEYIGKYYICQLDENKLNKFKLHFFALVLCSGATAIGVGFINNPGSRIIYVALPYVGLFLPIVFSFMATVRFIKEGKTLEQAAYDKSKKRMYTSTVWQIILSSMAFVGDVIFIVNEKDKGILGNEWALAVSMLFVLIINIIFIQLQKKVTYQVKDPDYNS
ncbi:MAG TPA: hypothetical protein PK304_00780 [Mobilitalea sp.]|nr:hypothetical protein [Mobilitalea sp.]